MVQLSKILGRNKEIKSFELTLLCHRQSEGIVYGPNSLIQGHVSLSLLKELKATSVKVRFVGLETGIGLHETVLFDISNSVWKGHHLPSGSHMYLFAIKMPRVNYPPSMVDSKRRISYRLEAIIEAEIKITTPAVEVRFLPLISTSEEHPIEKHAEMHDNERRRIAHLIVGMKRTAFVPDALVIADVSLENNSNEVLKSFRVQVISKAISHSCGSKDNHHCTLQEENATSKSKCTIKVATIFNHNEHIQISRDKTVNHTVQFRMPDPKLPTTHYSSLQVDYSLKVIVPIGGSISGPAALTRPSKSLSAEIPIIIGTVPSHVPPKDLLNVQSLQDCQDVPIFVEAHETEAELDEQPSTPVISVSQVM